MDSQINNFLELILGVFPNAHPDIVYKNLRLTQTSDTKNLKYFLYY